MTVSRAALAVAGVITALLVQACLIGPLTFPVPVSLPALVVIVVAILSGPGTGVGLGFAMGLMADLGSEDPAGVQALCWLLAGLVAGIVGGLATERGYQTRGIAVMAAVIGAASSLVVALVLTVLGSHGASPALALQAVVPVALLDALLGLALVPLIRGVLRAQGIRPSRPRAELVGRQHA
jgi:rod shape-determining protein MreD